MAAAEEEKKPSPWIPVARDYVGETESLSLRATGKFEQARYHPLNTENVRAGLPGATPAAAKKPVASAGKVTLAKGAKSLADDPLAALAGSAKAAPSDPLRLLMGDDPLSSSSGRSSNDDIKLETPQNETAKGPSSANIDESALFEPWRNKKSGILKKYTTNTQIPVHAHFLDEKTANENKAVVLDASKQRLALMETNAETGDQISFMSQKEYIAQMELNHDNLKKAWEIGDRVGSLKIAIQSAKMLGDISVPQFYPSMFVLITDILDTFSNLVYDRIKKKGFSDAQGNTSALPDDFTPEDVSLEAKETCRNWFFKTACIRELIPRLYIELALVKCYRFLVAKEFPSILQRISRIIRGIGDPLAAMYARAYLATKGRDVAVSMYRDVLLETFNDFLFTFKQSKACEFRNVAVVAQERLTVPEWLDLFHPAVQWVLQNIGETASQEIFFALLQQFRDYCNNSSVLLHVLATFNPTYISAHATAMTKLIRESEESATLKSRLYLTLGTALVRSAPPKEQRLPLLNEVWKVVAKIVDPTEYIDIATVFIEYLLQHFTEREINILLRDVLDHVKKDNAHKELQPQIHKIVMNILKYRTNFEQLLAMDNFMPLADLLEKGEATSACKTILESFSKNQKSTSDPVIIHAIFDVARNLHDSIDSLSFEDDRRQVANLIIQFIRKIDFGNDLEQQLNMYVECRHAFTNLDTVTRELVLRVALLAMKAHRLMAGKHTKKTAAFVKACLAYCHITIPSLDDIIGKLHLFLQLGEIGLVNGMVVQSEAFLKAAISIIPDVPTTIDVGNNEIVSTETFLVNFVHTFSAFLLLFPGHPEHGPFYLAIGLLNAIQKYPPWQNASEGKTRVYFGLFKLFATYYQRRFPYHIDKVESNDTLYGGDEAYNTEVTMFLEKLVEEILLQLQLIGEPGDLAAKKKQGTLALEFVNLLVSFIQMNPQSATMVVKLFGLAKKTGPAVDPKYVANTLAHVKSKKGRWFQDLATKLEAMGGGAATPATLTAL